MLNKLLCMVRSCDMIRPGDTVICAVSGGADSVALLFALYLLREKLGITLQAAHFNHHLRAEESNRDEAFVRALCDRYDIPLSLGQGEIKPGEKGLEAAAREARYAFFATLPGKIATAHTANDNAETVLMHLVRGTGLKGLGGIRPVRGNVIRPLLLATRGDVLAFLEEYHLGYVTDSSNETDAFLRNRLRHHVLPLLEKENPQLAQNLSSMALRLRQDEQTLEHLVPEEICDVAALRQLPASVRARALEKFLRESGVKEPEAEHIRRAEQLVFTDKPSAAAQFPGGVTIVRRYDKLCKEEQRDRLGEYLLSCPGSVEFGLLGLKVSYRPTQEVVLTTDRFTVQPRGDLVLRCRRPGDSMRLSGGTKTLKKLFIDRKIPASMRDSIPVICDDMGILGVYGIGANLDRVGPGVEISFKTVGSSDKL